MTKQNCQTCKFKYVSGTSAPCSHCIPCWALRDSVGPHPGWQPKERAAEKTSAREEQLQAQVDTYRQALADLMGELKNNTLTILGNSRLRWVWGHCQSLLDGTVPLPASSAAQCISRLMQDKDAMQTEIAELLRHMSSGRWREDELKRELAAANKRNTDLQDELSAANKRIAELEAELADAREQISARNKDIAELEDVRLENIGARQANDTIAAAYNAAVEERDQARWWASSLYRGDQIFRKRPGWLK